MFVAISEAAGLIVFGSDDKTINLWEIKTGRLINTLKGHGGWVNSVAISESLGLIVSGSRDNTIKLWDLAGGTELSTLYSLPEGEWAAIKGQEIVASNAYKYAGLGINLVTFPAGAVVKQASCMQ